MISYISRGLLVYECNRRVFYNDLDLSTIIFDYHVLKSGANLFDNLIDSLIGRGSFEVLNELESRVKVRYFSKGASSTLVKTYFGEDLGNCIIDGSFESIKFLAELCSEHIKCDNEILNNAFISKKLAIVQYLLDRFWNRMTIDTKEDTLHWAALYTPFEFFKSVFYRFSVNERSSVSSNLLISPIARYHFLTFKFLLNHAPPSLLK